MRPTLDGAPAPGSARAGGPAPGRSIRVLLVEDSPGDAELAARVLSRYADPRFEVVRARTLLEAIALARGSGYGAILLDLSLPDLSGLASVRELALAVPRTPIVVLTGTDSHASAIEAIRHGAQDYLVKGERDAAGLARAIQLAIERKACEAQLAERAHFDELTGLANRALFRDRLAQALARARRKGERTALLFIDLDGFKAVNDTLGHAAGDEVLRLAATRFRCAVRASETLARFGGDEFVVLIEGLAEAAGARRTAQRLVAAMRAPFTIDGKEVRVTPSIGIAVFPDDGGDGDELLLNADRAMFRAKRSGQDAARLSGR